MLVDIVAELDELAPTEFLVWVVFIMLVDVEAEVIMLIMIEFVELLLTTIKMQKLVCYEFYTTF